MPSLKHRIALYDNLNRLADEEDPHGNSATFAYNDAGLMTSRTDRIGQRRDFVYDELGRVKTEKWYNNSSTLVNTLTFTYDANGNREMAQDQNGTYTLTYDALDRTETVKGLFGITLTFSYDAMGNRVVDPLDRRQGNLGLQGRRMCHALTSHQQFPFPGHKCSLTCGPVFGVHYTSYHLYWMCGGGTCGAHVWLISK